ncbi:MAG: aminodeoxychorismate lyase [Thiogranum sp.]|nr:aminodeoxychorismate lyase [Thiogranum sp.]
MTGAGVWVNGVAQAHIAVADRAVQYGDGLFETIRVQQGRAVHLPRHLARLRAGCRRLGILAVPWDTLQREIADLVAQHDAAVLKVIVSRGSGARGYRAEPGQPATRILSLSSLPQRPAGVIDTGVRVMICNTRLAHQPALAGIKHLNRLEQIVARAEWDDPGISEGLMLDCDGRVVEGTMSNVFLVRGKGLLTPDLSQCGVAGVMRSVILDCAAQQGMPCEIRALTLDDVRTADEVFVCNSLIGIWPVTLIDGIGKFDIGETVRALPGLCALAGNSEQSNWYSS